MRSILKQLGSVGKTQDATELLHEDLVTVEQRVEPAKKAAQVVHKKLLCCLQSQQGLEAEKRMKKLPLMLLSVSMAESLKDFDAESPIRRVLEMCCFMEKMLANMLADFEMKVEKEVLEPLNKLSEDDLPEILRNKKQFIKLNTDWLNARNKCQASTGPHAKQEGLREEVEEAWRKLENIKDQYSADLYHFATKEDDYANYFIRLLELQADYHKYSHEFLDRNITELKENHSQKEPPQCRSRQKVYGEPLLSHLSQSSRDIASPIEECVHMLLRTGMVEEGLFRLAAAASVVKRLRSCLDGGVVDYSDFSTEPHAVAGALKGYLRELPEPLMTFDLYSDWFKAAGEKDLTEKLEQFRALLKKLPPENYNNLRYLVQFLYLLSEQQAVNKMSPSNIAIVLGPNLLWPRVEGEVALFDMASASSVQVVTVVEPLIQYCSSLFLEDISFEIPELPESPGVTLSGPAGGEKERLSRTTSSSSSSTASSSCSSSNHPSLSKTSSTASQDSGGGYCLMKSGSASRGGTTTWGSPAAETVGPGPSQPEPASSTVAPSTTLSSNAPTASGSTTIQSPSPLPRTSGPKPVQTRSPTPSQSSDPTGHLEPILEAQPESPKALLTITSPYKPKRSFRQEKMPLHADEQVVVQFSKPRAPVAPKPPSPTPKPLSLAPPPKPLSLAPPPKPLSLAPPPKPLSLAPPPKPLSLAPPPKPPSPTPKPPSPTLKPPSPTPKLLSLAPPPAAAVAGQAVDTVPRPQPRTQPPVIKKPPVKKPGLKAPKCPPPLPPPLPPPSQVSSLAQ
ncbi:SH3 domain-binding protein 1 [Diretmus argenteus]